MTFLKRLLDLLNRPFPPSLVDDMLIQNSLVMLVGAPGAGKTFVALDLALSMAGGVDNWLEHPLRVHGPVIYGVGEGSGRFKLRVMAWVQTHPDADSIDGKFFWTDGPLDLLDPKQVKEFIGEANTIAPKLVVIDTYSRSISGEDENEHATASQAVEAMDLIKKETGATVLVLHHTNAAGKRERGHTSFMGGIDTQLWLSDDSGLMTLESTKQKDLDDFVPIDLALEGVIIEGLSDAGGQPVSSAIIKLEGSGDGDMQFFVVNVLEHESNGKGCMSRSQLTKKVGKKKESVAAILKQLIENGVLTEKGKGRAATVCLAGNE